MTLPVSKVKLSKMERWSVFGNMPTDSVSILGDWRGQSFPMLQSTEAKSFLQLNISAGSI